MSRCLQLHVLAFGLVAVAVAGCGNGDPRIAPLRSRLILDSEPAGAVPVSQAVAKAKELTEVVVVGKISAEVIEPWLQGKAGFILSEALSDHGGPGHDAANCPFCKRRAKDAAETNAMVQFKDEDQQVIPIDARDLLGLKNDQVVVVRGRGVTTDGILVIDADGIHVRR